MAEREADEPSILVERHDGVERIVLNRPARLNSFDDAMHGRLRAALEAARDDRTVRAVLLTGAGRGFCAGQDLGERDPARGDGPPDLERTLLTQYNPLVRLLRAIEKPVVCAVNGVAAGAGANLALACDIVLAAESATFVQSFARVGLLPDAGGSWMLPRLVGEARAKALALTAAPVGATQAAEWGMIWRVHPDAELADAALALATELAAGPTFGLALTKRAIQESAARDLDGHLEHEASMQGRAGRSADYAEGVAAFLAKRDPAFRGEPSA